jgi:hypothetical protein
VSESIEAIRGIQVVSASQAKRAFYLLTHPTRDERHGDMRNGSGIAENCMLMSSRRWVVVKAEWKEESCDLESFYRSVCSDKRRS